MNYHIISLHTSNIGSFVVGINFQGIDIGTEKKTVDYPE